MPLIRVSNHTLLVQQLKLQIANHHEQVLVGFKSYIAGSATETMTIKKNRDEFLVSNHTLLVQQLKRTSAHPLLHALCFKSYIAGSATETFPLRCMVLLEHPCFKSYIAGSATETYSSSALS